MFELFPILKERINEAGGLLSGGEQQMLAIARSLMSHPKLLMLDEPSLGLSPTMTNTIFELIGRLRERGVTVLLVEQNAERALEVADRVYVLQTGYVQFAGTPKQLESELDIASVYFGGGHPETGGDGLDECRVRDQHDQPWKPLRLDGAGARLRLWNPQARQLRIRRVRDGSRVCALRAGQPSPTCRSGSSC